MSHHKTGFAIPFTPIDSGLREQAVGWIGEVLLQASVAALPHQTQ